MTWSRRYLPVVLLGIAILSMSGGAGSTDVTGRIANPLLVGLGFSPEVAALLHGAARKVGHFVAYALFAWLALRAARGTGPLTGRAVLLAAATALGLAAADEWLQRGTPDRTSSALDVAIDAAGALAALAVAALLAARRPAATAAGGGGPG